MSSEYATFPIQQRYTISQEVAGDFKSDLHLPTGFENNTAYYKVVFVDGSLMFVVDTDYQTVEITDHSIMIRREDGNTVVNGALISRVSFYPRPKGLIRNEQ